MHVIVTIHCCCGSHLHMRLMGYKLTVLYDVCWKTEKITTTELSVVAHLRRLRTSFKTAKHAMIFVDRLQSLSSKCVLIYSRVRADIALY